MSRVVGAISRCAVMHTCGPQVAHYRIVFVKPASRHHLSFDTLNGSGRYCGRCGRACNQTFGCVPLLLLCLLAYLFASVIHIHNRILRFFSLRQRIVSEVLNLNHSATRARLCMDICKRLTHPLHSTICKQPFCLSLSGYSSNSAAKNNGFQFTIQWVRRCERVRTCACLVFFYATCKGWCWFSR